MPAEDRAASSRSDFIRDIIDGDLAAGRNGGRVVTRFPPEPNGYLHIGHAKSICLNFGIAAEYGGRCNLRFDDTNPVAEDPEYAKSIQDDIAWLGFSFGERALYASDYFEEMYQLAEGLIETGQAFVDHSGEDQIREDRGSLGVPGRPSPYRDRTVADNLALFRRMRAGELPDGACVLRAKINLASPNMKMRDPLLYRIRHAHHDRTGDGWPIYPLYDWAHPLSDAIEGITHSLCTLEFENNRELYDWVIDATGVSERHGYSRPHQYEFARLNLDYTVMSKRKLLALVDDGTVSGWDDPRMPTIAGMRRRGYRFEAIRAFAELVGVAKVNSTIDLGKLEYCVRDDLNWTAPRVLGVLRPLAVTLTSWPEGDVEMLRAPYFPPDVGAPGERLIPLERHLLIEREDFSLDPPPRYQRLAPGRTVRLRHGPCITCDEVVEEDGQVVELRCHHVPGSVGRNPDGLTVTGVIHWVAETSSIPAEVRLYDRLFRVPHPDEASGDAINPRSVEVVAGARLEPSLADAEPGSRWQLERLGYFVFDAADSRPDLPVLNRIVTLRDSWQAAPPAPLTPPSPHEAPAPSRQTATRGATTRPPRRSRIDYRAEARVRDPVLAQRFASWPTRYGLDTTDVDLLTGDAATGDLFESAVGVGAPAAAVARWMINDLPAEVGDASPAGTALTGASLASLVDAAESGQITRAEAKEVLAELVRHGGDVGEIIASRGMGRLRDEAALAAVVDEVLAAHPDKLAQYRAGKTGLLGFFMGQVLRASRGTADPHVVQRLLADRLG